jgi:hypothetical protein
MSTTGRTEHLNSEAEGDSVWRHALMQAGVSCKLRLCPSPSAMAVGSLCVNELCAEKSGQLGFFCEACFAIISPRDQRNWRKARAMYPRTYSPSLIRTAFSIMKRVQRRMNGKHTS